MDLNKVMIIGNVVRDPELRTTPNGQNVSSFAVATNLVWKDASGSRQEKAEFHNVVAWRKLAEITSQYLKKGSKVYIEGRLQTRSWDDPNGVKKYRTEIIADNMIMLDRASGSNYESKEPRSAAAKTEADPPAEEISIEDIPF